MTPAPGTCAGCKWEYRVRWQKCTCCARNPYIKDNYEPKAPPGTGGR